MAIYLDVVYTDGQSTELKLQESTIRLIGEILPFVITKYGIVQTDRHPEAPQESGQGFDFSI